MILTVSSPRSDRRGRLRRGAFAAALVLCLAGQAQAATAIGARGWDHGAYGRLVFDLAGGVTGQAMVEGDTLVVTFSAAITIDPKTALGKLSRYAGAASLSEDGRTLRIALKQAVSLKPETYQGKLVLDLKPAPQAAAAPVPPPRPAPAAPTHAAPAPAAAHPETPPPAQAAVPAHAEPAAAHPPPPPAPAAPAPVPAATAPVTPPAAVAAATPDLPAAPAGGITVRSGLGGVVVEAEFAGQAGAAVFARGDAVWIVFDRPGFDPRALAGTPAADLGGIETIDVPGGSGFRIAGRQLPPQAALAGNRWQLIFGPDGKPPATPLVARADTDGRGGQQIEIEVAGARAPVTLVDPDIGDTLTVIPVAQGGAGVVAAARLPELDLFASAQGIAFAPLADGLETRVDAHGVVIAAGPGGLTLSDTASLTAATRGLGQATSPGVDVGTWDIPGPVGDIWAGLSREAAAADPGGREGIRTRLARFFVTKGLGAEAAGLARLMAAANPALADDAGFRLMRGIAAAQQERPGEALADLSLPALEFNPDAILWRAYSLAASGRKAEAHRAAAAGMSSVAHYPPHIVERLLAALGDAALAADDLSAATQISRSLDAQAATPSGKAEAHALAGRIALRRSDPAAARQHFEAALASGERIVRVDSELGLIELGLGEGTLTRAQAIERLDRLRYAWRGDGKELAVLRRLADLQLADGRWRDGLETLRTAMKLFPKDPGREALAETQAAAFRRLFLQGAADALPPVQAVALYFDFRDLTPIGADGDEMIRRLADRLIQVELLDQAKTLLTHQVTYRLQGIAQAQVAAKLALLHLADHEAAKALAVLDATEQPVLPDAIARLRRLMRASALAELGRQAEAKALLASDTSDDAARLGAEIAWTARDWPAAADSLGRLVAAIQPPASGTPDPATERLVLRLAIARSLARDAEGLKQLAAKWGAPMALTKSADAFGMLTGTTEPTAIATRNLAQTMANAGADTGFMDMLRQRLASGQLNAIN